MTVFLIIAVVMAVAALLWVLLPLMKRRAGTGVAGASINLAIYRDQLAELDADLSNGTLSADDRSVLERAADGARRTCLASDRWAVEAVLPLFAAMIRIDDRLLQAAASRPV